MVDEVADVFVGMTLVVKVMVLFAMKSRDFEIWIQRRRD